MDFETALKHYEQLIANYPKIERKGKTMLYTSVNGHMFSFIDKEGSMGLRLSTAELNSFIEKHNTKLMEQYGRTMKEYAVVPTTLVSDAKKLSKYFELSYDYVSSLKPKPTKKK